MQRLDVLKSGIDKEVLYKIKRQALVLEGRALVLKGLNPKAAILRMRERLVSISGQIDRREAVLLEQKRERILKMEALLVHINPKNLLKKGYAILFKGTKAVASVKEMASGDRLEAELSDGRVELEVV